MTGKFALMLMTACALALAGCAQGNTSADMSAAAPPPAGAVSPGLSAAPSPQPPPPPARQAALTPEEAKAQCWMKYENDRRTKGIDERLKLVEKCVDDTLRNQPPQR